MNKKKIGSHKERKGHKRAIFQAFTFVIFVFFVANVQFAVQADGACF
jgi:hypothetical protein